MPEPVCAVCGGAPFLSHTGTGLFIAPAQGSGMHSETRIYTTVAHDRIVEEGDPEAAMLVASAGSDVPAEYLEMYREYRKAKQPVADAEPEPEAKAVEKAPENKALPRSAERK